MVEAEVVEVSVEERAVAETSDSADVDDEDSDAKKVVRMLAVGQTAFALGKPVWIFFDSNSDSNPSSCYTTNCRLLTGISMVN